MTYHFHRPVKLAGITFLAGVREVSEKAEADPYFLKAVEMGWITDYDPSMVAQASENLHDRALRLKEKLLPKKEPKVEPVVTPVEKTDSEQVSDSEKKKGGKKPR